MLLACGGTSAGQRASSADAGPDAVPESGVTLDASDLLDSSATPSSDGPTLARPICGATAPSHGPAYPQNCTGVDQLVLSGAQIVGADGGAGAAPGSSATVSVSLTDPAGGSGVGYPCVGFEADDPRVTFDVGDPVFSDAYAILSGRTMVLQIGVQFGATIAPGTVVRFTAWIDVLNGGCTNGSDLSWDVLVQ